MQILSLPSSNPLSLTQTINYLLETVQAGDYSNEDKQEGGKIKYSCLPMEIIIEMTKQTAKKPSTPWSMKPHVF